LTWATGAGRTRAFGTGRDRRASGTGKDREILSQPEQSRVPCASKLLKKQNNIFRLYSVVTMMKLQFSSLHEE
jgi:hypothetical protein